MNHRNDKAQPKFAVLYTRVSSDGQTKVGDGLRSQERIGREFAGFQNMEVVRVFSDVITGEFADRPEFEAMLEFLANDDAGKYAVVIDDVTRFSRHFTNHWALRERLRNAGGVLMSPRMEFSDDPVEQLPEKVQALFAEHDRLTNADRTARRQRARTQNGYWTFYPGPAYEFVKSKAHNGKLLVRKEPAATALAEALEGFASGRFETQMEFKRFLDAHPDYPKGKTGKIPKQNIRKLLTNILYTGHVQYEPWGIPLTKGHHEALISYETHLKIQERLNGRPKFPVRKSINEDFPLRGCVDCADCGTPLRASWSKGRQKRYAYYVCQTKGCDSYAVSTPKKEIEDAFDALISNVSLRPEVMRVVEMMVRKAWELNSIDLANRKLSLERSLRGVQDQIDSYLDRIVETSVPSVIAAYEAKVAKLEEDRIVKSEKLAALKAQTGRKALDFDGTYRTIIAFLEKPHELWRSGRIACQRAAIKFTFGERLKWRRNEGYRTAELSLPFKHLGGIMTPNMGSNEEMVPLT